MPNNKNRKDCPDNKDGCCTMGIPISCAKVLACSFDSQHKELTERAEMNPQ
jgi:hypothetical protein